MSTGSAFLLTVLAATVLNRMRWVLATQPNGVSFKDFIGMSPATNVIGVFGLLFSSKANSGTKKGWLIQRCAFF
jgi:predicted lipase